MIRFVTGFCLGVSIAAFVAGLFVDVFVFPQAERDWGKILPNLAGISIFVGLMVSFFFWEMAGHAKDSFSRVVKTAPSRRWFYWGAGAGLLNGALIVGTMTVVVTIARWIPFLEEWALAVILGTGLLSTLIYGILTQSVIQSRVLKQRGAKKEAISLMWN